MAVAAFCLVMALCGCGKKEEPVQTAAPDQNVVPVQEDQTGGSTQSGTIDRMQDPVYTNDLRQAVVDQKNLARREGAVRRQMMAMMEKARKALPTDATEAQILEELNFNPDKYPGWAELKGKDQEFADESKKMTRATAERIRARIQQEKAERSAVAK